MTQFETKVAAVWTLVGERVKKMGTEDGVEVETRVPFPLLPLMLGMNSFVVA